jgi:hypothetical protein
MAHICSFFSTKRASETPLEIKNDVGDGCQIIEVVGKEKSLQFVHTCLVSSVRKQEKFPNDVGYGLETAVIRDDGELGYVDFNEILNLCISIFLTIKKE